MRSYVQVKLVQYELKLLMLGFASFNREKK